MCDIDLVLCASAEPQMLKARGGGGGRVGLKIGPETGVKLVCSANS